jgi:hypothetical protein
MTTTKNAIGDIGECFVQEFHGPNFILSEDKFDRVKDGVLGSMTAEIKTLTRMRNKPEYWLELNQYDKVSSVDLFFIVDIPIYANEGSKIYLCPNNKNLQIENRVKNGNVCKMVIIPEEKLYLLTTIKNDDRVDQLVEMSDSLSPFRRSIKEKAYA